ncbi:virulence factor TspB C-terminal domain-related protein [Variovorax sp. CF313]|uniref:virulence factor TspB C-terminal domain-related protein n=1 Tax=Variovorax sp. CF313 TaxID=1144315 RepID=UPI0012FA17DE|nr:virulence factor TspB C-terminal domain-related protein [Variovorax sp. CF313]
MNETSPRPEDWRPTLNEACAVALAHSLQVNTANFESGVVTACTVGQPSANGVKYLFTLRASVGGGTLERFSPVYQQANGNVCPANSAAVSGGCQCNTGYVENAAHTACELPPDPCVALAGKSAGSKNWNGVVDSFTFCDGWNDIGDGKCTATAYKALSWEDPPKSGKWYSQGEAVYTGNRASSCTGTGGSGSDPAGSTPTPDKNPPVNPPPGEAAPSPCPPGQIAGDFNGSRICAQRGSDTPVQGTDGKTVKNPDGSTTGTTGTTKCEGGKCTTDSTVCNTPAGGGTPACSTTTTTDSQTGFCNANKGSKVCEGQGDGTPTSFGGTCATGFKAVSDDAVLNAMALEQYKRNCQIFDTTGVASQQYATESAKTGDQTTDLPGNSSIDLSGGADMTDALGGGGCPADQTIAINVAGRSFSFVLAVSKACQGMEWLGIALVAATAIACAFIVFKD